jgi:hypothetical protein
MRNFAANELVLLPLSNEFKDNVCVVQVLQVMSGDHVLLQCELVQLLAVHSTHNHSDSGVCSPILIVQV